MYKKVDTSMNFVDREIEVLDFWKQNRIFQKSVELRQGARPYTFYDGPPTANGKPHIGHILTRSIKDIIPRYNEGLRRASQGRLGYPWSARRA